MPHSEQARRQLEQNRADLKRQLEHLESGQLSVGARHKPNTPASDETTARVAEIRKQIAKLDTLLGERDA
jgi:ribosomal protein L29